jgi:hypothetical protein
MAPFMAGATLSAMFDLGSLAVGASRDSAIWQPSAADAEVTRDISATLGDAIAPAIDEASWDAIDMLHRGWSSIYESSLRQVIPYMPTPLPARVGFSQISTAPQAPVSASAGLAAYATFAAAIEPIDYGSATVRRIHEDDSLQRLRSFNGYVVNRTTNLTSPSVQSLVISTRLIMIRDYAVAAAENTYDTVKGALDDLDFIMAVYDEEEAYATQRCDDALVAAIHHARAAAASAILSRNIRLPGIAETNVGGLWPSVVVAHKLYADGTRYQQVENYNPLQNPFFIGRTVVGPVS